MSAIEYYVDIMTRYDRGEISMKELLKILPRLILSVQQELTGYSVREKKEICQLFIDNRENFSEEMQIFILSFIMHLSKEAIWSRELILLTEESKKLSLENKYYIYNVIGKLAFLSPELLNGNVRRNYRSLYRKIYYGFKEELKIQQSIVHIEERNQKNVVFFTQQFLNLGHAPTRTILDRADAMAENGYNVYIINTSEFVGEAGRFPFFYPYSTNYVEEYEKMEFVRYKRHSFHFWQCRKTMPDIIGIKKVIDTIKRLNPYCLFMVGNGGITADLCSNFYPLITIHTVFSSLATTEGQFQLIGRKITEDDQRYMKEYGFSENHVQFCSFTFPLIGDENLEIDRKELCLPENRFIAIIVGWRLGYEVKEDFIEMVLLPLIEENFFIIFMGRFHSYAEVKNKYPLLAVHSVLLENIKNVLPYYRNADIYLNPEREGGGNSVVEAMYSGIPPLSLAYGDVYASVGEEFLVADYQEMKEEAIRLKRIRGYYKRKAEMAKKRSEYLLDSERLFMEVFRKIEKMPEFRFGYYPNSDLLR